MGKIFPLPSLKKAAQFVYNERLSATRKLGKNLGGADGKKIFFIWVNQLWFLEKRQKAGFWFFKDTLLG